MRRTVYVCIALLAVWPAYAVPESAAPASGAGTEGPGFLGRVEAGGGIAVEHARVTAAGTATEVYTDSHGEFSLHGCELPCSLVITHPRFHDHVHDVEAFGEERVVIALTAKQEVFEQVDVTASRGGSGAFAPASVASTVIRTEDKATAPSTLTELVEGVAGVAENGQGGIFQVFSIRGVSRHRVLTLVSGIPIIGERRAGVSTSFIDPTLMGSVDVLRGPASTHYGSGALGGVVQIFPRVFDGLQFDAGYDSFGDAHYERVGWGATDAAGGSWSLGVAHRTADNDTAADGSELNSHYTQYSASISRAWSAAGLDFEVQAMPSYGRDIGKSNSDFPGRITNYPRETHLLLRFGVNSNGSAARPWSLSAFVHPNDLITEDLRVGNRITEVENEAFDFGAGWQSDWSRAGGEGRFSGLSGRFGFDYVGRRGVSAFERRESLTDGSITELQTLDEATQDEAAAYGTLRWGWGVGTFQAGGRFTWQQQSNGDAPSRNDTAWTAFLGYVRPVGAGFELAANLGTGLRFPNLSERFFTGTTGRGGVIGNPDLDPEGSVTFDLGLRWYGNQTFLSAQVFHQEIDDYIERIEVDEDLLTFVNLTSGTIVGFELEGFHQISDQWLFSWSGHLLDGEDADGGPLADVPSDRLQVGLKYDRDSWESQLQIQHRDSKDDPGSGENPIPSAQLVSASVTYRVAADLALTLRGRNLLDEEYFNSADDKSPLAPGRAFSLSLSWSGG
ncbi:MAG: TonB-dependent receptor [bacterium]|nr:TonB-dependent receptor [bacterium]